MDRRNNKKNAGMTAVELLIAIFIFIILTGGSLLFLRKIYDNYGFAMEQGISVNAVRHSLNLVVEEMRGACQSDIGSYPLSEADDNSFIFFADIDEDGATERVHYFKDGEMLKKGVSKPNGSPLSYPTEDETTIVVSEHIVNTNLQPIFQYFDTHYPADQANNPLSTPVSPIADIRLVKIDVYFNLDPNQAPNNIRLESFVELRNLKDNW